MAQLNESWRMAGAIAAGGGAAGDSTITYREASAWFDTHLEILLALMGDAARAEAWDVAIALNDNLTLFLLRSEAWPELERAASLAVAASEALGDTGGEIRARQARAMAHQQMGHEADAEADFRRVDGLTAAQGDPLRRAQLLAQWAQSKQDLGRLQEANRMLQEAAALYRAAGSRPGEAKVLTDLGDLLAREGATKAAVARYSEAREIFSAIDDRRSEAVVLHHLGVAYARIPRYQEALDAFTTAASMCEEIGDEVRAARVWWLRAQLHWQLGNDAEAEEDARRAWAGLPRDASTAAEIASMLSAIQTMRAIDALIAAPHEGERRAVVAAHPELLDPAAEAILIQRLQSAQAEGRRPQSISIARQTLAALRGEEAGRRVAATWAELGRLATGEAPLPQGLKPLIRQILTAENGDEQQRLQLRRQALASVQRHEHPRIWARLSRELAGDLLRTRGPGAADRHDEAIATLEHVLQVIECRDDLEEWFHAQCELGRAYRNRPRGNPAANTETAISCFELALAHLPPGLSPLDWAAVIHDLGNAHVDRVTDDRRASVEHAMRCYEQALGVFTRGARPVDWARVQTNLGNAYLYHPDTTPENTQRAIRCFENALTVGAAAGPIPHALALHHLGNAYRRQTEGDRAQNRERAFPLLEQAVDEYERAGAPSLAAQAAHDLGIAYMDRLAGRLAENVEDAIRWYERALEYRSRDEAPAQWAATTDNLANAYNARVYGREAENLEQAIALQQAALEVYGPDFLPFEWARTLFNLAGSLRRRTGGDRHADLEHATRLYEQALEVRRRDVVPVEWAETVENLAATWASRTDGHPAGNLVRAEGLYREALEVFRSEGLPDAVQRTAGGLGDVLSTLGRWSDAVVAYREAVEASELLYQSSLLRESKNIELGEAGDLTRRAAYAQARAGDAEGAVIALEHGRARALGEALARDAFDLAELREAAPALFAAYRRAAARVRTVESVERSHGGRGSDDQDPVKVGTTLGAEARDARAELSATIGAIRALPGHEGFASPPSLAEIARAASSERPLVYLVVTAWGAMALVVSGPAGDVNVTSIRLDQLTLEWLQRLLVIADGDTVAGGYIPAQLGDGADVDVALQDVLPQLGRLTKPIANHLRGMGAGAVTLVPTGGLGLVPLHAGVYPEPEGARSLLDDFDVAYAPSARAAIAARGVTSAGSGNRHLVAVSNPTGDLPYASLEVDLIRGLFASHTVLRSGDAATKAKVVDAVRRSSHVHFACHGRYNPKDPLSSHLALADGPLTLREVIDSGSFAGVGLVVASACQSAVTEFSRIPDEAIGFPAGFLQAGAAGIVATLWSVPDLSSSLLMNRFYELLLKAASSDDHYAPVNPAAALAGAQRWLRNLTAGRLLDYASRYPAVVEAFGPALKFARARPNARPFARPSYWAPYLYVGA